MPMEGIPMRTTFLQCVAQTQPGGPGGPTEPPEYTPGHPKYAPPMSAEEYAAWEEEVAKQPPPKDTSSLAVEWNNLADQPDMLAGNAELKLADLGNGELYSLYVQPGTDVSPPKIIIYPIQVSYINDYGSAETFDALPDGSLDWLSVEKKYFPNGFIPMNKELKGKEKTSSKKIPDGFWHKVLSNLLDNFSAKHFYSKNINNPYIVKRHK